MTCSDENAADPWKLTRDLAEIREEWSRTGAMDLRDYYRRSAAELRTLIAIAEQQAEATS